MMQQILKGPKSFTINDDNISFPYKMRKRLLLPRNIQGLDEPVQNQNISISIKNAKHKTQKQHILSTQDSQSNVVTSKQLAIPYQMSKCFLKYMLFYRIVAYLTAISLILSIISVYGNLYENILILVNNAITLSILLAIGVRLMLYKEYMKAKKQNIQQNSIIHIIIQMLIIIPHPTIWTHKINHYFHLLIMLRFFILIKFLIQSSLYFNVRAYRIININGLNASQHFFFAVKSLVQSLNFIQILAIQLLSVLFFTHCMYLVSINQHKLLKFIDCFQIVMVTMPTVGFGEYDVPFIGQKIVLFLTVVNGAVLNSFVTLSMLSHLQMNQAEQSSYLLFKKIQTRQHIQHISKNYIQKSFTRIRSNFGKNLQLTTSQAENNNQQQALKSNSNDHVRFSFRSQYQLRKSLYNSISYTDINNLFGFYRDGLVKFRISCIQTANMISILIRALNRYNFACQLNTKQTNKQSLNLIFIQN